MSDKKLFVKGDTVRVLEDCVYRAGEEGTVLRVTDALNVLVRMQDGTDYYFRPEILELANEKLTDYSASMQDPRAKKIEPLDVAWSPEVLRAITSFGEGIQDLLQDFNNKEIFDMKSRGTEVTLKIEGPEDTFTVSFVPMTDDKIGIVFANVHAEKK